MASTFRVKTTERRSCKRSSTTSRAVQSRRSVSRTFNRRSQSLPGRERTHSLCVTPTGGSGDDGAARLGQGLCRSVGRLVGLCSSLRRRRPVFHSRRTFESCVGAAAALSVAPVKTHAVDRSETHPQSAVTLFRPTAETRVSDPGPLAHPDRSRRAFRIRGKMPRWDCLTRPG